LEAAQKLSPFCARNHAEYKALKGILLNLGCNRGRSELDFPGRSVATLGTDLL
jgi:hypothetical protein